MRRSDWIETIIGLILLLSMIWIGLELKLDHGLRHYEPLMEQRR